MLWRYIGKRSVGLINVLPHPEVLNPGDVFEQQPGYNLAGIRQDDYDHPPDPRERPIPKSPTELITECDYLPAWVGGRYLPWFAQFPRVDAERIVRKRLDQLIGAAVDLGLVVDELPTGRLDERAAKVTLNKLRRLAADTDRYEQSKTWISASEAAQFSERYKRPVTVAQITGWARQEKPPFEAKQEKDGKVRWKVEKGSFTAFMETRSAQERSGDEPGREARKQIEERKDAADTRKKKDRPLLEDWSPPS